MLVKRKLVLVSMVSDRGAWSLKAIAARHADRKARGHETHFQICFRLAQRSHTLDPFTAAVVHDPAWRTAADLMLTAPGVGPATVTALLAGLPELGRLDRRAIASLIGVAPLSRDSGALKGRRTVWGGRRDVRAALYMAALVASRHNPIIQGFYKRLIAAGKPPKAALTACMRKLLTILNAMLRDQIPWTPKPISP